MYERDLTVFDTVLSKQNPDAKKPVTTDVTNNGTNENIKRSFFQKL